MEIIVTIGSFIAVYAIYFITVLAVCLPVYGTIYALHAYAFYKTALKFGYEKKYLAFIPFVQTYTCYYMLSEITGRTDFSVAPAFDEKIKLKSRKDSFILLAVAPTLGSILVVILCFTVILIPVAMLISLLMSAIQGIILYVYVRDYIDMFRDSRENSQVFGVLCAVFPILIPIFLILHLTKEPVFVDHENEQYEENTTTEI